MYVQADLRLLSESMEGFAKSPYFDSAVLEHATAFVEVIDHVLLTRPSYNDNVLKDIVYLAWVYHEYLKGSSLNQKPHEIEYCMHKSLDDWLPNERYFFATALIDKFDAGKNFHFMYFEIDPWEIISSSLMNYAGKFPKDKLILIGLPRMYNHTPLYCTPLYHELGHFIDISNAISETVVQRLPLNFNNEKPNESKMKKVRVLSHIREHFADLFAACYIGETVADSLDYLGATDSSDTHPATAVRNKLIRNFVHEKQCLIHIEGKEIPILEYFQDALSISGLRKLEKQYELPDLSDAYNDIRPYPIESVKELHGLFPASWQFLKNINIGNGPEWVRKPNSVDHSRIINNLVAKSIQNYSVKESWHGVA